MRQAALGANFACMNENSLALAEEICRVSPACERLRFCASGTEATMYCQRLARAATGRRRILKFEGAYYRSTKRGDGAKGRALMLALFRRKVFLNPMGTKLYLSVAHSHDVCDRFLDRFADALQAVSSGRE